MARRELSPAQLTVVQAVEPWLREAGRPIMVACSGGADSMALALAVAHLISRGRAPAADAVVIDHQLQDGSAVVAERVVGQLARYGLPARVHRVRVEANPASGMEAAAREARYAGLAAAAGPNTLILLGHTLDDQAETVLLGLARGSGTRSLAGMRERMVVRGAEFGRPLLGVRRVVTAEACHDWQVAVWHDPHNQDKRFTRVRVRTSVLPTLEAELGPGIAEALARTAALAMADADELDAQAALLQPARGEPLPVEALQRLPDALATRVLRGWLVAAGVPEPGFRHLLAVRSLVDDWHGQRGIDLPAGKQVVRREGVLLVAPGGHASLPGDR
ncbi:MAG: tRNA lysidine(34) synthetase TilS [Acidobacteriota bacterium]|nr:tRNA lysidine(34) synthetase TilS [Acidobacteriota bacterium]